MIPLKTSDQFGHQFLLCAARDGVADYGAAYKRFSSLSEAKSFASHLRLSDGDWRRLASASGQTLQANSGELAAHLLYQRQLRIYPLPSPTSAHGGGSEKKSAPQGSASQAGRFLDGDGRWQLFSPSTLLAVAGGSAKPEAKRDAARRLQSAPLNAAACQAVVDQHRLTGPPTASALEIILSAVAEGKLLLLCTQPTKVERSSTTATTIESASHLPGSRPVEPPPPSAASEDEDSSGDGAGPGEQQTLAQQQSLAAADGDVLTQACASAAPFCEECAA